MTEILLNAKGLCLAAALLVAGCGPTAVETHCNSGLDGLTVEEAKEILEARWTYFAGTISTKTAPLPHVTFWAREYDYGGSKGGDFPACLCAPYDEAHVGECELALTDEQKTEIWTRRFCTTCD